MRRLRAGRASTLLTRSNDRSIPGDAIGPTTAPHPAEGSPSRRTSALLRRNSCWSAAASSTARTPSAPPNSLYAQLLTIAETIGHWPRARSKDNTRAAGDRPGRDPENPRLVGDGRADLCPRSDSSAPTGHRQDSNSCRRDHQSALERCDLCARGRCAEGVLSRAGDRGSPASWRAEPMFVRRRRGGCIAWFAVDHPVCGLHHGLVESSGRLRPTRARALRFRARFRGWFQ